MSFTASVPLLSRVLVDDATGARDVELFIRIVIVLCAAYVLYVVAGLLRDRQIARISSRVVEHLRREMYARLQQVPIDFFARRHVGDLTSHFSSDLSSVQQALRQTLPMLLTALLQAVLGVVLLFLLNWPLALAAVVVLPLASLGPRLVTPRALASNAVLKSKEAELVQRVTEDVSVQPVVRGFGLQLLFRDRFDNLLIPLRASSASANFLSLLVGRTASLTVVLGQALVLVLGASLVFVGSLSAGTLIGFVGVLLTVNASVNILTAAVPEWLQASASIGRITELLDEPGSPNRSTANVAITTIHREIAFQHVTMTYEGATAPSLNDVSLAIPAGAFVAFVGSSGSGKSTLLNLLLRLYEPTSGRITFDGVPLADVSEGSLRSLLAVVFQDAFLLDVTMADNIRLAKPSATQPEIEEAARAAQIHDTICGLPEGYESMAGERGSRLSGGQRQRVALARAIVCDPAVLLLDEATSALDPVTEAAFDEALKTLRQGRTVISVTHRLPGIREADRIFVLDGGQLVEQGTHNDLIDRRGHYYALWEKQTGFTIRDRGRRAEISAERLGDIPLFGGIDPGVLAHVAKLFFSERYEAGATVFRQGDVGDKFYVLVRGTAEQRLSSADGRDVVLDVLEDGDFFGDIDLMRSSPRSTTVQTKTECLMLTLSEDDFRDLVVAIPVLRTVFEHVADVRQQREAGRVAELQGSAGWSDHH